MWCTTRRFQRVVHPDITAYYNLSSSDTVFTAVDGYEWSTAMPSIQNGTYLWQKYIILKNDNTTMETDPVYLNAFTDLGEGINNIKQTVSSVESTLTSTRGDVSNLQTTTTQMSSQIETALTGIQTNVTSINQVQTSLTDFKKTTQSDIKQSAEGLKIELSKSIENTNKSVSDVTTTVSEMKSYMDFTTDSSNKPVLELGSGSSNFKTRLSDTELAFMQGATKVAYISESKLNITEAHINTSLRIGNFAFVPRNNGSLDFKKVGGD